MYLIEISRSNFPGFAGEVDVVGVVHFAEVVEAAPLQMNNLLLGKIQEAE